MPPLQTFLVNFPAGEGSVEANIISLVRDWPEDANATIITQQIAEDLGPSLLFHEEVQNNV